MAQSSGTGPSNRLINESSPYLRQHAQNPVDWYPWGEEALARARAEDKPILLSIGYSACHWCHVMADESFADRDTAEVMNALFINIKVDREERPDLDRNYQLAHHILNQSGGGWPLTCFLDPNTHLPYFSGTYFPKRARYQLPSFVDLLRRVHDVYRNRREDLDKQADKLRSILGSLEPTLDANAKLPDAKTLARARASLANAYDSTEGGFGDAPKFPMPAAIERLLRHWAYSGRADNRESKGKRDRETLDMVMYTLTRMARGGIYDHLGGGFCRYSTDRKWVIPHFEKMLYDNGSLLALYADATAISRDALFQGVVSETAAWVMREMQHPEGGYFASVDADSEGQEGRFYAWRRGEVKALLDEDQYLVVETLYGLDKPANFESKWVLHRTDAWHAVIERLSLTPERGNELLATAKATLFAHREQRPRPGRDDKVITSWNGLMILGMARAGAVLGDERIIDSACAAADFVRTRLWQDGRLQSVWADGTAKYAGYLDDYAYLLDGLLALLQTRWRDADLRFAVALADAALLHFEDTENGGFFFTAHDHEALIHRSKPTTDEALPPGNAVLARALHRLGHLMGVPRYIDAAERTLRWTAGHINQAPSGFCSMLTVAEDFLYPPQSVLIHGPSDELGPWRDAALQGYVAWRSVYAIPNDIAAVPPPLLPPYLPRIVRAEDRARPAAYVCTGTECSLPIRDLDALRDALK